MSPTTAVRVALTAVTATLLLLCAYGTGHRAHCHTVTPVTPIAVSTPETTDAEDKIRQSVRDFAKERYPKSRVEGVFLLPLRLDNLYLAGADLTTTTDNGGTLRYTADLLVRLYVRRNGTSYWRAESLGAEEAARLRAQAITE